MNTALLSDFPKTHTHDVTLFFYPSPGMDWSTPFSLVKSTVYNKLVYRRPRAIGHVSIMLRTPDSIQITGMTQEHKHEGRHEVLFHGYGLGILTHVFQGALETTEQLAPELVERAKLDGKLSYLRFDVSAETIMRLKRFLKEYADAGGGSRYGMVPRPLYGEGSGCSAFAAAFLIHAGLMTAELENAWTRSFRIPKKFMGGPAHGKKVPFWKLLFARSWAHRDEEHVQGFFWDPDLMHSWLTKTFARERVQPTGQNQLEYWHHSIGISRDARNVVTPTGPVILKDQKNVS